MSNHTYIPFDHRNAEIVNAGSKQPFDLGVAATNAYRVGTKAARVTVKVVVIVSVVVAVVLATVIVAVTSLLLAQSHADAGHEWIRHHACSAYEDNEYRVSTTNAIHHGPAGWVRYPNDTQWHEVDNDGVAAKAAVSLPGEAQKVSCPSN